MRISDWSSDVCSSDLRIVAGEGGREFVHHPLTKPLGYLWSGLFEEREQQPTRYAPTETESEAVKDRRTQIECTIKIKLLEAVGAIAIVSRHVSCSGFLHGLHDVAA